MCIFHFVGMRTCSQTNDQLLKLMIGHLILIKYRLFVQYFCCAFAAVAAAIAATSMRRETKKDDVRMAHKIKTYLKSYFMCKNVNTDYNQY